MATVTDKVNITEAVFLGEGWQVAATVETKNGSRSGNDYVSLPRDATEAELSAALLDLYS